jgi:hypothetical protein
MMAMNVPFWQASQGLLITISPIPLPPPAIGTEKTIQSMSSTYQYLTYSHLPDVVSSVLSATAIPSLNRVSPTGRVSMTCPAHWFALSVSVMLKILFHLPTIIIKSPHSLSHTHLPRSKFASAAAIAFFTLRI